MVDREAIMAAVFSSFLFPSEIEKEKDNRCHDYKINIRISEVLENEICKLKNF